MVRKMPQLFKIKFLYREFLGFYPNDFMKICLFVTKKKKKVIPNV